jgi:hypothetical protein
MVKSLDTSLLHFDQNKLFKNMVCILALFRLFGPLFKKLGDFIPNHLVTLLKIWSKHQIRWKFQNCILAGVNS